MKQLGGSRTAEIRSEYEGSELKNELILKSDEEFMIREVRLLAGSGAKLPRIQTDAGVRSEGFRVHIPHSAIIVLVNGNIEYGQFGRCAGAVWYRVSRDGVDYEGKVPFEAQEEIKSSTVWIRLVG